MLRIATDPRSNESLATIRDELTILDVLDLADTLDFWQDLSGGDT